MLIVALLLLPAMGLLLLGMDRIEDRMGGAPRPESGDRRRLHLSLVRGGEPNSRDRKEERQEEKRGAAARGDREAA